MGWKSFHWVATIPPIFMIMIFKIYLDRTFLKSFKWYVPSDEEMRLAKVHSERHDSRGGKLEKRFGHPALHAELFTPMLHAKMMPFLREVYSGRIKDDSANLDEYGGQKMEASIVPGGIKIAAVHQSELEYDPALYQRDRGELDWDQRSIGSTTLLNEGAFPPHKPGTPGPPPSKFSGYDTYMQRGPTPAHEFEMSRFDTRTTAVDQLPLLSEQHGPPQGGSYFDHPPDNNSQYNVAPSSPGSRYDQMNASTSSLIGAPRYPPGVPRQQGVQYPPPMQQGLYGDREASLHRPQQRSSRSPPYGSETGSMSSSNLAGRGAHRSPR